jgi:outer membrane protein assembly factor BamB
VRRPGVRSILLLLPLALAACSGGHKAALKPALAPATLHKPKPSWVRVFVLNGDTGRPVRGAVVRVADHPGRTNHRGQARILLPHRGRLVVTVARKGYQPYNQRLQFTNRPLHAVKVFQSNTQWTMYGASPQRDQTNPYIAVRPPFRMVWSAPVGALIEFPAVVYDQVAYISNYRGSIRAFSMHDGSTVWRHDTPDGKMAASPAVVGNELIVHGMDGHVWVLNRFNGKLLWRYHTGSPIESSPVVIDGIDYFGDWGGTIYALNLRTHRARWTYHTGYKITSSASFMNGTIFIGDYSGRLLALSARNGHPHWTAGVDGRIYGTPAVASGRVFVPSSDGNTMNAFSTRGRHLWTINTGAYVYSSPAVWNGRVYFGSYNGDLYCVSAATGRILWRFSTAGSIGGAPTVVDGIVYFANRQHRIYGVNARSGRQVFRFADGAFVPVSGNGSRLLLHGFSRLYAVEPRRR